MNYFIPNYKIQMFMKKKNDIVLLIPVLNEGIRIQKQILELSKKRFSIDIVIADGGSTDGSLADLSFFKNLGVRAILQNQGSGKLSAQLHMGFYFALKEGYKYLITMDGNGKDGTEGITMISNALYEGFDFVQGSRFVPGGVAINTPRIRHLGIRFLHAPLTSLAARRRFTDTTNGFRGYSRKLIESDEMSIFREIFSTYELIFYIPIRASQLKFLITEVPVSRTYPSETPTPTKIVGPYAYFKLMLMLIAASIGKYNPKKLP